MTENLREPHTAPQEGIRPYADQTPAPPEQSKRIGSATLYLEQASSEAAETALEYTPESFLQAIRSDIQIDPARGRANGRKSTYIPARSQLLRIHEALSPHQKLKAVTSLDVERLGFNVARLHTDLYGKAEPTFSFLQELYGIYVKDAEAFKERGLAIPGVVAIHHTPRILEEIDQRYAAYPFINRSAVIDAFKANVSNPKEWLDALITKIQTFKETTESPLRREYGYAGNWEPWFIRELFKTKDGEESARKIFALMAQLHGRYPSVPREKLESWAIRSVTYRGERGKAEQAAVAELLSDIPHFTYSELGIVAAEKQLEQLRQAHRDDVIALTTPALSAPGLRLASVAKANWHSAFEAIDLEKMSSHIAKAVLAFNQNVAAKKSGPAISSDPQNLCHILVVFASDLAEFHRKGVGNTSRIAKFHSSKIFDYYKEKYDLEEVDIRRILTKSACGSNGLEKTFLRLEKLKKEYGDVWPIYTLCELACKPEASTMAEKLTTLAKKAATLYPWATKTDIASLYAHADMEDYLFQWDAKLKKITSLYPKHRDLPQYRRKLLASFEGDAQKNVQDYFSRVEEIMKLHKNSPFVSRFYALRWSESRENYLQMSKDHVIHVQEIKDMLQHEGFIHIDPATLGHLAFNNDTPSVAVSKFLTTREMLDEFRQDHALCNYMDQWMVDLIATKNTSPKYLQGQLTTLALLKKKGKLETSIYRPRRGFQIHQRLANPPNSYEEDRNEIKDALSSLVLLDRRAVMAVFGLSEDDKAQLEEELDVPNLDEYVLNEVIPHLISKNGM